MRPRIRLEFKPQDLWIGVFWRTTHLALADKWEVWICLLPTLPIHIWRFYNVRQGEGAMRAKQATE